MRLLEGSYDQAALLSAFGADALASGQAPPRIAALPDIQGLLDGTGNYYTQSVFASPLYAAYRSDMSRLGGSLVWEEFGKRYRLELPDAPLADGRSLREAEGIIVLPLNRLSFDPGTLVVRPAKDFDPRREALLLEREESHPGWVILKPRFKDLLSTAFLWICHPASYEAGSTGWHGSIVLSTFNPLHEAGDEQRRDLEANGHWYSPLEILAAD